jgi:outer membrane porin, OprD family
MDLVAVGEAEAMAGLIQGRAAGAGLALALIASGLVLPARVRAQGAGGDGFETSYPIPSTAAEAYSPIGEGFESPIEPREDLKGPKHYTDEREERLKAKRRERRNLAPFFRDTDLRANSRTYWFDENDFGFDTPKAFTTGGDISYQSGFIGDFLQLRGALYTTQPLYANADAGETLNLTTDGDQITTLGQANVRMEFAHQQLTVGRQLVRTPYMNPYDVRMIPITFEGIVLLPERKGQQPLDYIGAYLTQYKPRNQANFVPLSEGLGVTQDEGVLITGIRRRTKAWNYGIVNYWIKDTLNTAYGEVDYLLPFGGGDGAPSFRASVNDLDQATVGEDLIAGAPYHTYQASARLVASYQNFVLTGAISQVGDEADIQKPFGFDPAFTSMFVTSFHEAGVKAYTVTLSYDFAKLGLDGVTFRAGWGKGNDAIDPANNQHELDLMWAYEPHGGVLQGLRVEVDYIDWRLFDTSFPSEDLTQFRAIVNYEVPLL